MVRIRAYVNVDIVFLKSLMLRTYQKQVAMKLYMQLPSNCTLEITAF